MKQIKQPAAKTFIEMRNREIVAIIAYLQRLGTDIKVKEILINRNRSKLIIYAKICKTSYGKYHWDRNLSLDISSHFLCLLCNALFYLGHLQQRKTISPTVSNIPLENQNDSAYHEKTNPIIRIRVPLVFFTIVRT
jgi:hypothetical protein